MRTVRLGGILFVGRVAGLLGVLLAVATSPCLALSPQASAFVKSIGLNPDDPDVIAADKEGAIATDYRGDPVSNSLEELASAKKANAVRAFVFTRKLVRQLKADFNAKVALPSANYDSLYLTKAERALVGRKVAEQYEKQLRK